VSSHTRCVSVGVKDGRVVMLPTEGDIALKGVPVDVIVGIQEAGVPLWSIFQHGRA